MSRILIALAVACLALPAADGAPASGAGQHDGKRRAEIRARHDTDKDGTLSDGEKAAGRAALAGRIKEKHPEAFARVDADHDGTLSDSERTAARERLAQRLQEKRPEVFAKVDKDHDGSLSPQEVRAFLAHRRAAGAK